MTTLIGVDIGTSGCKCAIYDAERREPVAIASRAYSVETPEPGRVELDPELVLESALAVIRDATKRAAPLGEDVSAIGLAGASHSLLAVDESGRPLTPCITNLDTRASAETAWLREEVGVEAVYNITFHSPLEKYPAPKILWLRNHRPDVYARVGRFLLLKDYVVSHLSGEYVTDQSSAAQYLLYDQHKGDWSEWLLERLGLEREKFCRVQPSAGVAGGLRDEVASRLGLPPGTAIAAGVTDTSAAALGVAAFRPGQLFETTGTSTALVAFHDRLPVDPSRRVELSRELWPGVYTASIINHGTGACLRWVNELLGFSGVSGPNEMDYGEMERAASMIRPGSDNLLFLPYLAGGVRWLPNPSFPGVVFGLRLAHTKAHLARAVLEGVAFGLRISLDLLKGIGIRCEEVRVAGGGARNRLWRKIKADVLEIPVVRPSVEEPATLGAALVAGAAVGIYDDLNVAAESYIKSSLRSEPELEARETYTRFYHIFKKIPESLAEAYTAFTETARPDEIA